MAEIRAKEAYRDREALTARVGYVAWTVGVVGVVAILAWLIISWVNSSGERGMQLEQACIEGGGMWTQFGGSTSKMCVYVDRVEQ